MKTQLKQAFKSSWALILAVVIGLSALTVTAATLNPKTSGRSSSVQDSGRKNDVEKSNGANDYYYVRGEGLTDLSWDSGQIMTEYGNYWYFEVPESSSDRTINFKITKGDAWTTAYGKDARHYPTRYGDVTLRSSGDNCKDESKLHHYIVFYPGSNNIFAVTVLPESSSTPSSFYMQYQSEESYTDRGTIGEFGTFFNIGSGKYSFSRYVASGTNYIYVYVPGNSSYQQTLADNGSLVTNTCTNKSLKNRGDSYNYFKYVVDSPGLYTFTISDLNNASNPTNCKLTIEKMETPLAESCTLTVSPDQGVKDTTPSITLSATLNSPETIATGKTVTYTFKDWNDTTLGTVTKTKGTDPDVNTASWSGTSTQLPDSPTTKKYKVVVTTNDVDTNGVTYAEVSGEVDFTVLDKLYYYKAVTDSTTSVPDRTSLTTLGSSVGTSSDTKYSLALYDTTSSPAVSASDENIDYEPDNSRCEYCTITKRYLNDPTEENPKGTAVYDIKANSKNGLLKGPFELVVDATNQKVYAKVKIEEKTSKTGKTVRYYFGRRNEDTTKGWCHPLNDTSTAGVRIAYWNNNRVGKDGKTFVDVTSPANHPGNKGSGDANKTETNIIYVYSYAMWGCNTGTESDLNEYQVFYIDLPITATSFAFTENNNIINCQCFDTDTTRDYATLALNPDRIYLFDGNISNNPPKAKAITLDAMFWYKTTMQDTQHTTGTYSYTNQVGVKYINSNFVNYKIDYSKNTISNVDNGSGTANFNDLIGDRFQPYSNSASTSYKFPIYQTYMEKSNGSYPYKLSDGHSGIKDNYKRGFNLAMRADDNSYYASVQGLTGDKLSSTKNNLNGFAYMLERGYYDASGNYSSKKDSTHTTVYNMPYFDYDVLKVSSNNLAYNVTEQARFPFNKGKFDGIETYSFDSTNDYNRYIPYDNTSSNDPSSTTLRFDKAGYVNDDNGDKYLGLFPYAKAKECSGNSKKLGYGAEFDIDFYMSSTGYLMSDSGRKEDIAFNFTGDDDVWVYVDGNLVLDIGGAHKMSAGTINFTDMKVYYKTTANSADNGLKTDGDWPSASTDSKWAYSDDYIKTINLAALLPDFDKYDTSEQHSLQMFYMERGGLESNCSISFNLPQNSGLKINNSVDTDEVNPGLENLTLTAANKDSFKFNVQNKKTSAGQSIDSSYDSDNPLYPQKSANYVVRRIHDPDDNRDQYVLVCLNNSDGASSPNYVSGVGATLTDSYSGLPGINYVLEDAFAEALLKNTTDDPSHTSSSDVDEWAIEPSDLTKAIAATYNLDISGKTDASGNLNLFMGQSAKFIDKLPAKTDAKVTLSEDLDTLNNPGKLDRAEGNDSVVTVTSSDRKVTDYYSTEGKITNNVKKTSTKKSNFTSGAMSLEANLDPGDTDTVDVVADFVSKPLLDKIKISKTLYQKNGTTEVTDLENYTFRFNLAFTKLLGYTAEEIGGTGVTSVTPDSSSFTYKVYDSDNNQVGEPVHGLPIVFKADQYVIVEGVPAGSEYQLTEESQTGFDFVKMTIGSTDYTTNGATGTIEKATNNQQSKVIFTNKKAPSASLTIKNEIDVSKVNPGLQDAAKWAANSYMFDYKLENKYLDSDTEGSGRIGTYDKDDPMYPLETGESETVQRIIGSAADPLPDNKMNLTRRYGTDWSSKSLLSAPIYLAAQGVTPYASSAAESTFGLNKDTYSNINNVNFTLSDIYADRNVIGRTANSVQYSGSDSSGDFYLMYGQSANFIDKILGKTKVRITQQKYMKMVGDTSTSTPLEPKSPSETAVDDWFTTKMTIYDKADDKYIYFDGSTEYTVKEADDTYGNRYITGLTIDPITGAVTSSDGNGKAITEFEFKNRKNDTGNSDMTVTFINSPIVKPIKIEKTVTDDSTNTDEFYFNIRFYKVLGINSVKQGRLDNSIFESNYQTFSGTAGYYLYEQTKALTYNVYKKSDNSLRELNRTYGTDGIHFGADEYAVIYGIPEDTLYSINEDTSKSTDYIFSKATLNGVDSVVSSKNVNEVCDSCILNHNYTSSNASNPYAWRHYTDFDTEEARTAAFNRAKVKAYSVDEDDYASAALNVYAEKIEFTNRLPDTQIVFKYYDREIVTGQPEHLATTPSVVSYEVTDAEKTAATTLGVLSYSKLIKAVVNDNKFRPYNVLATYSIFTSQDDAILKVSNMKFDAASILKGDTVKYAQRKDYVTDQTINLKYHTDPYGRVQGEVITPSKYGSTGSSKPCTISDNEKWVTYDTKDTKDVGQAAADTTQNKKITKITIWLAHNLRTYSSNVYFATASSQLSQHGTRWVANPDSSAKQYYPAGTKNYYGTRMGIAYTKESADQAYKDYVNGISNYMKEYFLETGVSASAGSSEYEEEIPGEYTYTGAFPTRQISETMTTSAGEVQFLGWAMDPNGKYIVSVQQNYEFRITNDIQLYAVYAPASEVEEFLEKDGCVSTYDDPDCFYDSEGHRQIRINTVFNPYNSPAPDDNIKQVASFYVYGLDDAIEKSVAHVDSSTTLYASMKAAIDKMLTDVGDSDLYHGSYKGGHNLYTDYCIKVNGVNYDSNSSKVEGFKYTVVPFNAEYPDNSGLVDGEVPNLKVTNKNRTTFANYFPGEGMWNMDFYAFTGMKYGNDEDGFEWKLSDNAVWYNFGNHTEDSGAKINKDGTSTPIEVPDKYTVACIKYFFDDDSTQTIYEYDSEEPLRLGFVAMS